ncbi:PREDICTED: uncharacterized protein LOC105450095 [Wasmannia auropunctata]|uniref:uncharacterized protein LOC105450095 n=1 Tax=Wasmannia auropunctata TaxID=64793 RepID=UPI0005EDE801|nr:PREDICTED: uncharacterized protein LOC105450095 [Wasmannia auropunctata]
MKAIQPVSLNMETIFAKMKKKRVEKFRGPDSPLYKVIWPMIYVVRIFGFAPYNFAQDRLVPSNINLIFTVIAATFYSYVLYAVFARFLSVKRETWTLGGTENTKVIINYTVVMYELGLAAFTRRSFVRIWNALQDYDESVRQLGYPRKEMRTAIVAWILIIVSTIIWIMINRIGMYAFMEKWSSNMGYMMPYIGTSVSVYKFAAMAIFLGQRFRHLNAIALKNLPSTENNGTVISKKTILSLHNDLMIAGEDLESLYSLSLLFWLGHLSLHTVSNIYFVITWMLVKQWDVESWPLVSCFCNWLLAYLFQLLLLHIACDFASSQANCIGPILIEWQVRLMKKNKEGMELSLQFLNRKLKFSAGGCFYVNLPLLRSIASLMTTYLVILLQLQ